MPPEPARRDVLGAGSAALAALAGCGGPLPPDERGTDEAELAIALARPPLTLDPIRATDVASRQVANEVFERLYSYDFGMNLMPELAVGDPERSRDGRRYVVELADATFHDGERVTAEDVVYSTMAPLLEGADSAWRFSPIEDVTAVDEETVQFDLSHPFPAFEEVLTWYVVPKHVRESDEYDFEQAPVGTGPFEFVEQDADGRVLLRRWDDYWGSPSANLERLDLRPVTDDTERVSGIKTGKVDVVERVPPPLWRTVQSLANTTLDAARGLNYFYLGFNCWAGPTADPQVREAIDYAVSMDAAVTEAVEPAGSRQYSPFPYRVVADWGFPIERWAGIGHDRDIDEAKTLLDAAESVPPDWEIRVLTPRDTIRQEIAVRVVEGVRAAGYGGEVVPLDWPEFSRRHRSGTPDEYNCFVGGWIGIPDPDAFLYPLFSGATQGVLSGTYYTGVADLVAEGRRTDDERVRYDRYVEAVDRLLRDRAHLPIYSLTHNFGVRTRVEDFRTHPLETFAVVSQSNNVSITED